MGNDSSKSCSAASSARPSDLASKRYKVDGGRPRRKAHSTSCSPPRIKRGSDDRCSVEPSSSPDENSSSTRSSRSDAAAAAAASGSDGGEQIIVPRSEIAFPSKTSEFDNTKHFMPRRDRLLIVKSWRKTQKTGAEHIGSKIFLRVLTTQPDIKAIFGLEKIPQGRLKYDPRFRQHALVYTKTFDYVVKNLEFPEKLEHHFDLLGRRHVQYQGRGFDPSFWETFAECMTQSAAEWEQHRHRPTTSAWRSLVSTIIMFMRRGFDDEIGRKKSTAIIRTGVMPSRKSSAYLPTPPQCPYSSPQPTYTAQQAQDLMPSRKSSAYLPTPPQCPYSSPQPTYTAQQAQDLYHSYAHEEQRKYSMDQHQRRSKSQTPY